MFGGNDQNQQAQDNAGQPAHVDAPGDSSTGGLTSFTMDPPHPDEANMVPPSSPVVPPSTDDSLSADSTAPTVDAPQTDPSQVDSLVPPSTNNTDLVAIKQKALSQLSPIISHLDQAPEDKFKTLMMMIQASDDQTLISEAYETAQQLTDDKAKAQALLDIVNEINYFTQHSK